jgi:acetyl-CoA synthetase
LLGTFIAINVPAARGADIRPATRTAQLVRSYSSPSLDVAQLLCDRHPGHAVAARVIGDDLSEVAVTYAELAESSRRFAAVLSGRGIGRGDRVATLMGKSVDLLTVLVGTGRTVQSGPGPRRPRQRRGPPAPR